MKNESQLENAILAGIAQALDTTPEKLPADFSANQTAKALGTTAGVLAVWRCRKSHDLPYFKFGKGRIKYPLFGIVRFKLKNLHANSDMENVA